MIEFSWPVRVYYEDTDAGGVVYYANYLKYLERARTEFLRGLGIEQDALEREHNIIFAVRSMTIDYLKPAFFNELLNVSVTIAELRKASICFHQAVSNHQKETLCTAEIKIACIHSKTLKPVSIPEFITKELGNDA
jgi:acyl-CoA thioester hydrolase